jgi:hypothetical protein
VLPPTDLPETDDPAVLYAELARRALGAAGGDLEADAVARVYNSQGRHRAVRDPRTGARVLDVAAVLRDGQIDAFLLATLRQASAAPAPARAVETP